MGRKCKGSNHALAIIICINNVKIRISLDSEEKIQSKDKSLLLVKHLAKEYKKITEGQLGSNLVSNHTTQFIPGEVNPSLNIVNNQNVNNNELQFNSQKTFAVNNASNKYEKLLLNNNDQTNILENITEMKNTNVLIEHENPVVSTSNDTQTSYISNFLMNTKQQIALSEDSESEKVIAEWDRLWGDGSNSEYSNQIVEKELFIPDCLSSILI